jgi:protein-S-isoprenylcysteine O-methyltransferase
MVREDHKVVTAGPYRVLRHPVYSGTLLMMLGYGIMLGNWLSLVVITGGVFLAHVPRVLHEERVLERDLGYSYRAFEYRRKRLIPFLW